MRIVPGPDVQIEATAAEWAALKTVIECCLDLMEEEAQKIGKDFIELLTAYKID